MVIVALIAMMSVACKNKVTGMNEFTLESEEITAPSTPAEQPKVEENTGVDQFKQYTYKSGVQSFKQNPTVRLIYTASISDGKITIKVTKEDGTIYNGGQGMGQDQIYTATGTGSTYTLTADKAEGYNLYIEGGQVYAKGGTATFDASGYLTIKFDWGGTIRLSTQK